MRYYKKDVIPTRQELFRSGAVRRVWINAKKHRKEHSMSKVLIIGGGAAGMMAGVFATRNHHEVHILEKNEKLGKKVFITGKGRCNVANACDTEELFPAVMSNPKFLYSGFYSFGPQDVMNFFEEAGVPLKVERGNRVFPQSDHSSDIIRALERELKKAGAKIHLHTAVREIVKKPVTDSANTLESEAALTESGSDAGSTGRNPDNSCMETGCVSAAWKSVFHRGRLYHQRNDEHLRPSFICMAGNHLCIPVYIFPDCNTWKRNRSRTALLL